MVLVSGCATNPKAESERKLAEAEKKLDEAVKALSAAQAEAKLESAVDKARADVKATAGQLEAAAAEAKSAAAAKKVEEARRMAEPPKLHTVAAGSTIAVRTLSTLSTKSTTAGANFEASLHTPLVVDGYVVAERGAMAEGVVTESDPGGRVKGRASLSVALRRLTLSDGKTIDIQTRSVSREAPGTKKKDAAKIGIGAGIGAAIGAIVGGGKGAAIGAGAGAAGGTGVTLATRGDPAVIPVETLLQFHLTQSFTVQEVKRVASR